MTKYKEKMIICLMLYAPIAVLVHVVPNIDSLKQLMTQGIFFNGVPLYAVVVFLLASTIQFWLGGRFYTSAYKSLKHRSANMDVLVSLSTTAAWLYGTVKLITGYSIND
jgi:Cu+-exporting ATPase